MSADYESYLHDCPQHAGNRSHQAFGITGTMQWFDYCPIETQSTTPRIFLYLSNDN